MPDEIRVTRDPMMSSNMSRPMMGHGGGSSKLPWVVLAIVVLVVIIGAILFRDKLFSNDEGSTNKTATTEMKSSGYQAVFLTNGQVYFGKLSDTAGTYATLRDIYYLQVATDPLQGTPEQQQAQQAQQQQRLLLVKLGKELHGPVDEMKINRDQILFYEDIKEDGQVVKSIREYQANPDGAAAPSPTTPPATPTK